MSKNGFFQWRIPGLGFCTLVWTSPSRTFLCKSGNSLSSFFYKLNLLGLLPKQIMIYSHPHVPPTVSWDANFFLHWRTSGLSPRCWRLSVEMLPSTESPSWKHSSSARVIFYPVCWHALPSFKALHLLYHLQVFRPYCQIFLHIFPLWVFPSSLPKHHLWSD